MIIGIVGKSGSGKDTVAAMIPGARRFSFADPLKEFCAQVFGWDRETLWGSSELRNRPDPRYLRPDGTPLTPRYALQTLGTDWGRNCCPDVWALAGVRRAQEWLATSSGVAVFSDCRFINEARAIREAGGQVWRVLRPGAGLRGEAGVHPSELEQDSQDMQELVSLTVNNTGTLEELALLVRSQI
jgi:hypothetical protein